MIIIYLVWFAILCFMLAAYFKRVYSRFSKYGVAHVKPVPILGNIGGLVLRKYHVSEDFDNLYYTFPKDRYIGRFEFFTPLILVKDLDLIKQITVKDFEFFLDHRNMVDDTIDPMFGRNLFSLKGQEWKDMRSTLSPAFTSSKIRAMVPFMVEVNAQMIRMLEKKMQESTSGYVDIEAKDVTSRYTNDVIATCAFGVKVDSHSDTNNEFYKSGRAITQLGFRRILVYLGYSAFPKIMKKFNVKLFKGEAIAFFNNLFLTTMVTREEKHIIRPDMIHLLMEAKKGKLTHDIKARNDDAGFATVEESDVGKREVHRSWSDTDLVAQAVLFFIAGFETVSSAMTYLLYELALNPEVQDRLVQEIREYDQKNDGKFDFTTIQSMKYMDMVISEVLRLWPPAIGTDRLCQKDYNLGKPNADAKHDFILRKGEPVTIPVFSIHRDPAYFPNPLKFDPERFSDENRDKIRPFSYLPFGAGPRNCIGSRFALCEVKVMVYQLLQKFEVSPCEKTPVPPKLSPNGFNLSLVGGHWVRLSPRK